MSGPKATSPASPGGPSLSKMEGQSPELIRVKQPVPEDMPDLDVEDPEDTPTTQATLKQIMANSQVMSEDISVRMDVSVANNKTSASGKGFDIFLSHLQRNAQDAIIAMRMYLKQAQPSIRTFIDLEVDMKGDLQQTLHDNVRDCAAFLFFITDGILESKWCAQEIRWAVQYKRNIILVRETDERHGAIDMKDFFKQVPEDLMETFQNIIAIPWYRQPAYRDVSIKSILTAARLTDPYEEDMKHLIATRDQLESLISSPSLNMSAIELISEQSVPLMIVFFMGGFWKPRSKTLCRIYKVVFNVSFWLCGALCALNIFYKALPYHMAATDFLTAYVHLPAWQGWRMWRQHSQSPECQELVARIFEREDFARTVSQVCRVAGWLILVVQMVMVSNVLVGFSLPNALGVSSNVHMDHLSLEGDYHLFENLHAGAMWFIKPPVIASMFASYSMFAFISVLHILDVQILKETLASCSGIVARFQASMRRKRRNQNNDEGSVADTMEGSSSNAASSAEHVSQDLMEKDRFRTMEERLYENVYEIIGMLTNHTQRRVDQTCSKCSWVWVHLVFFSTLQIIAIDNGLKFHSGHTWGTYTWWWGCQDFFHLAGGILLLSVAFGVFCCVKVAFDQVPPKAEELFSAARAPRSRLNEIQGCLRNRQYGMHIFEGQVYVDVRLAFLFFSGIMMVVVDSLCSIVNEADVGKVHPRASEL